MVNTRGKMKAHIPQEDNISSGKISPHGFIGTSNVYLSRRRHYINITKGFADFLWFETFSRSNRMRDCKKNLPVYVYLIICYADYVSRIEGSILY